MKWLHIKSESAKDTIINLKNISLVSIYKNVHREDAEGSCECWIIEAVVGNCVVVIHKSPTIPMREGVESDKRRSVEYEQKCKHFYRELMSYITQDDTPDSWETRKVMFAPDYTSSKVS